ncbi:MAG: glycine cleavage system protein [Actinomycetota bacterium]|nr:glycine cleavage system protein [Actinomycetota bacterium]
MSEVPGDRQYTAEHEWVKDEDGRLVVGITDHAQDQLGDVVFVGLPEPGTEVQAGQPLGEVESTKSVSDVYSPVTGRVVEKNADVEATPELLNDDPYGRGWLVKIQPEGGEATGLLSADDYQKQTEEG